MSFEDDLELVQKQSGEGGEREHGARSEHRGEYEKKHENGVKVEYKKDRGISKEESVRYGEHEEEKELSKKVKSKEEETASPMGSELQQASETVKKKLEEALDREAKSTNSISKEGNEWVAEVEVIDEEYLPGQNLTSMNDIIGVYTVKMSDKGELISWNKKSSRQRGNIS